MHSTNDKAIALASMLFAHALAEVLIESNPELKAKIVHKLKTVAEFQRTLDNKTSSSVNKEAADFLERRIQDIQGL